MRLVHALGTALFFAVLVVACAERCHAPCGIDFDGQDCEGFGRVVSATLDGYDACDAGTAAAACAALDGYRVHVLDPLQTSVDDAGNRYWPAPSNTEGVTRAYGMTDCAGRSITLADEGTPATAWELVNASQGRCPVTPYVEWDSAGLTCVYQHGRVVALTGASGGNQ